jgi:hypothetical protein
VGERCCRLPDPESLNTFTPGVRHQAYYVAVLQLPIALSAESLPGAETESR